VLSQERPGDGHTVACVNIQRWDLGSRLIDYRRAWAYQRELHGQVVAGADDTTVLLEHESVYTAGKRTAKWDRPQDDVPVVDVDRGGRITWHGPGQLVAYPIVRLAEPVDVVAYVRALEQAVIEACAHWGIVAARVQGRSGAWILGGEQDRKIAAIGVRVARGVAMHGVAINADPDLNAVRSEERRVGAGSRSSRGGRKGTREWEGAVSAPIGVSRP